jgi:hypothetical protein
MSRTKFGLSKTVQANADAPFLAAIGDPAFIKHRDLVFTWSKLRKVLTIQPALTYSKKVIKRKDGKMATKTKIQTTYMQNGAVWLLAGGAVLGAADLLGGGLRACLVASLLVVTLLVTALDYRK